MGYPIDQPIPPNYEADCPYCGASDEEIICVGSESEANEYGSFEIPLFECEVCHEQFTK
jgi:hypothetical protein